MCNHSLFIDISDLFCVSVSHQPRPVDDPVQLQSNKDELENVN